MAENIIELIMRYGMWALIVDAAIIVAALAVLKALARETD